MPKRKTPLNKLNLGCGHNKKAGFINVDKFGEPDVKFDLESSSWPWKESSAELIELNHVLEHLGQTPAIYCQIIQELYRVCHPDGLVKIVVPHFRHDFFANDPTHVRIVTAEGLRLFDQKLNRQWIDGGYANSTLGIYYNVDFEVVHDEKKLSRWWAPQIDSPDIHVNAYEEWHIHLKPHKPARAM